eukprot:gene2062-1248_t
MGWRFLPPVPVFVFPPSQQETAMVRRLPYIIPKIQTVLLLDWASDGITFVPLWYYTVSVRQLRRAIGNILTPVASRRNNPISFSLTWLI